MRDRRAFELMPRKRWFDLACAVPGLLVTSPIIGLLVFVVRADSPGPALLRQQRVGRDGRPFTCYKLRTMYVGTGDRATHLTSQNAITRAGRVLRATKLDELPQFYNVVRGEMSLVGPRPCLPNQTELVAERKRRGVLDIQPGITGLAQVQGIDMSTPRLLARVDAVYARNRSIRGDIALIMQTILPGAVKRRTWPMDVPRTT
jgi:O-antigen biosynthesis protein WbqP